MEKETGISLISGQDIGQWAVEFSESQLCPSHLKNRPKDILFTIQKGRDLGVKMSVALEQIFVIKEKTALSTHLYRALALNKGITWKVLKTLEPIYLYADTKGNKYDFESIKDDNLYKIFPFAADKLPSNFVTDIAPQFKDKILVFKSTTPIDYVTKIEFYRKDNGMRHVETFNFSRAVLRGLATGNGVAGTNPNWDKMPKEMCEARCFTTGLRVIGGDIVNGMPSVDELKEEFNIPHTAETIDAESTVVDDVLENQN